MEFVIRAADQTDYAGLCAVFAEAHALHRDALPHIFREPDGPVLTAEFVADVIADHGAALFVAEHNRQIVGLVHLSLTETPDRPILMLRQYVSIHSLVVRQACRHAGIGRAL